MIPLQLFWSATRRAVKPREKYMLTQLLLVLRITLTFNTYIALIRMRSKRFTSIVLQYDLEMIDIPFRASITNRTRFVENIMKAF